MTAWLDTHLHLIYPQRLRYEWTSAYALLQQEHNLAAYQEEAVALGIGAAVAMEADVHPADMAAENALFVTLAAEHPQCLSGAIAACRPENADEDSFAVYAEGCAANPLIRGYRRVLHTQVDDLCVSARFHQHVQRLTASGRVFELCILPHQYTAAATLLRACPQTTFVLDHCGNPDIAGHDLAAWQAALRQLAAFDNLHCKISGLVTRADSRHWPNTDANANAAVSEERLAAAIAADLRPYLAHVIDCFGWRRLVWGSDYPVCKLNCGLRAWKQASDLLFAEVSSDELSALTQDNARRLYRLAAPALSEVSP